MQCSVPIDYNFNQIIVSAIRYGLGRSTYIVDSICSYVTELIPKLDTLTLYCVERDIISQEKYGYGADTDKAQWMTLLVTVREELEFRLQQESDLDSIR